MTLRRTALASAAVLALSLPVAASAQWAVTDPGAYLRMAQEGRRTMQMIRQMEADFREFEAQTNELLDQTAALTGTRSMGDLFNSGIYEDLRTYLPGEVGDFADILNSPSAGSAVGSRVQDYFDDYAIGTASDFGYIRPNDPHGQARDRYNSVAVTGLAAAEEAYASIETRTTAIEGLIAEINNTTDLKASLDLNSRLVAEQSLLNLEVMRLQTIAMQVAGAADVKAIADERYQADAIELDESVLDSMF